MINVERNGATADDFISYRRSHSESLYSMGERSSVEIDDVFIETAEIMGHSKDFFLHNGVSLMID